MRPLVIAAALTLLSGAVPDAATAREIPGLPYFTGPGADPEKHVLDLYLPDDVDQPPMLLWIHGGAWAVGSRKQEAALARRLAERGIAVAAMDYRLSPATWIDPKLDAGVHHPAHAEDCARAFAWLREHAGDYGYDADRLFLGGYSCGGHLSALLALDPKYLAAHGLPLEAIRGAVPVAGGYDMEAYYAAHLEENGREMADSHVLGAFGSPDRLAEASPTSYLQHPVVPMLVISETDTYDYTRILEERVAAANLPGFTFFHERGLDHAGLFRQLSVPGESPARDRIVEFLRGLPPR